MARQLNDYDRARIMADYHAGMSHDALALKFEVSKATVNKLCKGVQRKNAEKVNALVRIRSELQEQTELEADAVHRLVEQKTRDMQFFRTASMLISKKVIHKVETEDLTMFDLEKAQNVIGKGRENIYGKVAETAVQINNNNAHTYKWESEDD